MRYSPRNIKVACDHEGLTHVGGIHFFHEFLRVLQLRHFLATHLTYPRRNNHYHLSQMLPGELTRPQNSPVLRLRPSPMTNGVPEKILAKVAKLKPLES